MKAKDLKKLLENVADDAEVYVSCEGYTNYIPYADEPDTRIVVYDGKIFISDGCACDLLSENDDSSDMVTVICDGKESEMERSDAVNHFLHLMAISEGSEKERYTRIFQELISGATICSDK